MVSFFPFFSHIFYIFDGLCSMSAFRIRSNRHRKKFIFQTHVSCSSSVPQVFLLLFLLCDLVYPKPEYLLLLRALIQTTDDVRSVLAFNGAVEAFVSIAYEVGGVYGTTVAQDCLTCVRQLVAKSTTIQRSVRESECLPSIVRLLDLNSSLEKFRELQRIESSYKRSKDDSSDARIESKWKFENVLLLLDILSSFLSPSEEFERNQVSLSILTHVLFFFMVLSSLSGGGRGRGCVYEFLIFADNVFFFFECKYRREKNILLSVSCSCVSGPRISSLLFLLLCVYPLS